MRRLACDLVSDVLSPDIAFPHRVDPGETVAVELRDCFGGFPAAAVPERELGPNPVTGPLAVTGVEVGETVAVELLSVEPVGNSFVGTRDALTEIPLDPCAGLAIYAPGLGLPLAPNVGTIGVAPADGPLDTLRAGDHGGNLDCTIIGPGATVCFLARAPEVGLGLGDVHAVMGDGEISGQGLEVAAVATLRVHRVAGLGLPTPYGLRGDRFFIVGWGDSFDGAVERAETGMVQTLMDATGLCADRSRRLLGVATSARVGWLRGPTPTAWLELDLSVLPATASQHIRDAITAPLD